MLDLKHASGDLYCCARFGVNWGVPNWLECAKNSMGLNSCTNEIFVISLGMERYGKISAQGYSSLAKT